MVKFVVAAAAAVLSVLPASAGAAVVLNMGGSSNCATGGCFVNTQHHSQTWSAGLLDGPQRVNSITLNRSLLGNLQDHMITINFYAGDGSLAGSLGSFTIAGLIGDELTLSGQGFTWNPEAGDLTVRITLADWAPPGMSGSPGGGGGGFFFRRPNAAPQEEGSEEIPSATLPSFTPPTEFGQAPPVDLLVTPPGSDTEAFAPVIAVPEPGTWALMIGGFGLAGAALRRRKPVTG